MNVEGTEIGHYQQRELDMNEVNQSHRGAIKKSVIILETSSATKFSRRLSFSLTVLPHMMRQRLVLQIAHLDLH